MFVLSFLQNIIVGILVSYLSFTNTLAQGIESLFTSQEPSKVIAQQDAPTNTLKKVAHATQSASDSFPKVLLEHAEYQRAAIFASHIEETGLSTTIGDTPISEAVANALVNVYCQYKTDEYIRTTTGTGVFINTKGVILTNAHVAQFLLLQNTEGLDGEVECVIRAGNPATPRYIADLLYISPTWIFENPEVITEEMPRGTGERDYALLYIKKSIDATPLPAHFPAIPIYTDLLSRSTEGIPVLSAGYPAEVLMRNGADTPLPPVIASTTVGSLYTFGSNYADLFTISESPVGEHGASGGPVVDLTTNNTIGLIVTKGDIETEGEHSLRALTLSYIDRTMEEETGFSLAENMQGDVAYRSIVFKKAMAPFLADILKEALVED